MSSHAAPVPSDAAAGTAQPHRLAISPPSAESPAAAQDGQSSAQPRDTQGTSGPAPAPMAPDERAAAIEQLAPPAAPAPRTRRTPSRRSLAGPSASNTPPPQPGTFLTRFLGTFRPPAASSPARPHLPRSLSSPILSPSAQGANPDLEPQPSTPGPSSSTLAIPGGFPAPSPTPPSLSNSFARRLRPSFRRRASGGISQQSSPSGSPASSPGLSGALSDGGTLSPSSPATLRGGAERDPMDAAFGRGDGERRGSGTRRGSIMSQVTVQAHDHAYASGAPSTPLEPIDEPDPNPKPRLDQSLELIATLLPPALLLLSQLGPTHLFSPPVQLPALFEATLAASATRKSSISSATGSNALLSSSASIASTATGSTTSASTSFFSGLPITDHLIPTHSHELHAPSTLSVPAVSAGAIWRLFRGFEWVGEVGRGAQPLPHSPLPPHLGGQGGGPPLDPEDDPEQVFDFPSLLQGVADVLAADAAARGIELVVGQVGSGSAPSPVTTPDVATDVGKGKGPVVPGPSEGLPHARPAKDSETRELLVRADERAWSVTLIWILHHILAGASSGCTIDVRFLATAATPPPSPTPSRASSPEPDARPYPPTFSPSRPQKWWNVSLEILLTAPPLPPPPPFIDETAPTSMPPSLAVPPFDTPFAKSLFSLVQLHMVPSLQGDATSRSWALEALLPAARPKTQSITDDPSTLLGRRRASLDTTVGQEPSMNDLKRFAETALKGHRVALHAGETSAFAKHLTTYLAGWGMDVQHIPIEHESLSSGSTAVSGPDKTRVTVGAGSRFDSGFETAATSPAATAADVKPPELGAMGEGTSSLVIIDDDISTLRRLLVSLGAPPLHVAPGLMGKRPQLATRRTRSSPHVRQLHQVQQGLSHAQQASQWVIVHFASLTHYKAIKEIVQDTLATSKSASIPEVLVVPKPAGPRRIITAIWTALKRPAVDPSLAPIATSPTSPGIQYWTPRLSPALAKDHDFDFGGSDPGSSKSDPTAGGSTLGKPRTPPIYGSTNGNGGSAMPPSPLGRIDDNEDSYFSTVTEELKDASTSEGMIVQSPDGRSGIFFQPQPRNARNSLDKQRRQNTAERERRASLHRGTLEEAIELPASRAPSEPPSIPLSRGMSTAAPASEILSPPGSAPPSTPALTLDSFITAAKSRANGEDISPEELPPANGGSASPLAEGLQRQMSIAASARGTPTRRSLSGSSGSAGSAGGGGQASVAPSPRGMGGAQSPLYSPRRGTSSGSASPVVAPSPAPSAGGAPAAAAGAAAAKALAQSQQSAPPKVRSRSGTIPALPKNRRRSSRKGTLPAVPPISVLIVEDNPINQTILSMFMKKKGISYKVAKDGEQAVQMWKKGNFHLVLMDIQLPVKDGIEATREIRELERQNNIGTFITTPTSDIMSPMSSASGNNPFSTPSSPLLNMPVIIVALTASSLQADRVAALAAGCNDFLTKPVSLVWLESKLVEWGSMAYLSGFSRKAVEASDASATSSTRASTPSRPTSPVAKPKPSAEFKETAANRADNISQHLHIERPTSRANSPSNGHRSALASIAGSPSNSPEASPPTGAEGGQQPISSAAVARALNPSFTLTSPTPDVTPGPVPAIPGAVATPAPAAGGDAKETLDRVEEKLEGLIQEQEELGTTGAGEAPQRPGPTPLPPSVVTAGDPLLDSVVAESQRLIRAGRGRANSASFGQAMAESGVSSSSSSAAPSAQNSANDIRKIPPPRD